ncbi:acetyl-CoA sensor PanZ family protein [Oceanisphaera psychrotolerans]|uniref:GNAT family N-acetyltransferase n=1 Tax=Oceanisphaera psychrotolerans TaxID=1414654 RepID=A0A1J4QAH0_9GAMM|nr:acetyl-CoA sensor PanZ family protein [Oceanisphaera psychrotolerans]OIN04773.1 GNAT family N-acetyltransferase [Oceanisphaera psychrotolerans]
MRLTIHCLDQVPALHRHHADIILQGRPLPEQAIFYLATFNDKAVALAWRQQERLEFIAVRDITRRRGIGRELLRQIMLEASAAGLSRLDCNPAQAPAEQRAGLADFLTSQGFNTRAGLLSCCLDK